MGWSTGQVLKEGIERLTGFPERSPMGLPTPNHSTTHIIVDGKHTDTLIYLFNANAIFLHYDVLLHIDANNKLLAKFYTSLM